MSAAAAPKHCQYCFKQDVPLKTCSKCKITLYCSKDCQISGWKLHKTGCASNANTQKLCKKDIFTSFGCTTGNLHLLESWSQKNREPIEEFTLCTLCTLCTTSQYTTSFVAMTVKILDGKIVYVKHSVESFQDNLNVKKIADRDILQHARLPGREGVTMMFCAVTCGSLLLVIPLLPENSKVQVYPHLGIPRSTFMAAMFD